MYPTLVERSATLVIRQALGAKATATGAPIDPVYAAETNAPKLLAIAGTFCGLATLLVLLRTYCRVFMIRSPGMDDYTMWGGLAFALANMGCFIGKEPYGMGRHFSTITQAEYKEYRHIQYFQSQTFVMALGFVKISTAFLLLRLAPQKKYRYFLWGMIIFMILFSLACMGTLIFNCWPVNGAWDPAVRKVAKCYSPATFTSIGLFNTSMNVITDVIFATIPIPLIWNLQMNRRAKIALGGILSLGYFACIAGIIKGVKQSNSRKAKDSTFHEEVQIWGFIHVSVGIIAACCPTLKPLFTRILGSTTRYYGTNDSTGNQYGSRSRNHMNTFASKRKTGTYELESQLATKNGDIEPTAYDVRIGANDDASGRSSRGSQERILPEKQGRGIVLTTEVVVRGHEK
ncbi:hypothetical protein EX30DRAFT_399299 [Ascodesmis nigricans]|uniref:Rhodopsin domain-containing protein n=1 Tax=Ascodesmis nigricans TaxID=341454 RepID=A0A4S2MPE7_9PEZI|nr:hypothetical protein EX30DRAFT_399299 [Ascodesmis nigricans]